jgi:uncharacterized Zn-binding protein involved in type VI secretion
MFLNCQKSGKNVCFPDVCKTPAPPAPSPVPIPYPNLSEQMMGAMPVPTVLIDGGPAHTMKTKPALSNGDNAGVAGGVKSSRFMGPTKMKKGSSVVKIKGNPATKMLMPSSHNSDNGVGVTLQPSQTKVMALK